MRIGGPEIPAMPYAHVLEAEYLISTDKLEAELRELAAY
jgi:2-oxoisovalerate dehydrogenase E1 component beta subunit